MKKILFTLLLSSILQTHSQTDSGNLESYLQSKIAALPQENGNDYTAPLEAELTTWTNCIDAILANNIATARTQAANVNYRIVEYTDTAIGNNDIFYVLEEEAVQSKYWGTYVFAKNADRPNLILQAPHSDFDFNTGKQAIYSFVRLNNKALFLNGTHRCNHNTLSTCAGTTTVCNNGVSQKYRISDLAHNTETAFQKTTEIIYNTIATSVFFQLHGFTKKESDPYVILGNGTDKTPNVDYASQLKSALKAEDNVLTFKLGHLDDWDRLLGTTNTQGRLINQSNNPCNQSAQNPTGRFLHIEQEKERLRSDSTGWDKMYQALKSIFTIPTQTWVGNTTDWNTPNNWSLNSVPLITDNVVIPDIANQPIISTTTNAVVNNITIDNNATVSIANGGSLIVDGFATVNGSFIYNLNVNDDKWHLISSPVKLEQYDDAWNTANNIATNHPNEAVAKYVNTNSASGDWIYYQNGSEALDFEEGIGYSLKKTAAGDYVFTGTYPENPIVTTIKANDIGVPNSENRWNLVGNPFPSYLNISSFITANSEALKDTHESVYVWNANAGETGEYQPITTGYLHPGQAFFVNSNVDSTSVSFSKEMLSSQNGITFYRSSKPKLNLFVSNKFETKSTEINFSENKTLGLDPGSDIGTFTGQSSKLSVYTHLVSNSEGVKFMKQSLPYSGLENSTIPIGIKAKANTEIEFNLSHNNLPEDISVFLEDKTTEKKVNLFEDKSTYKVHLNNNLNGVGRFYLHFTKKTLTSETLALSDINIYKENQSTLRIDGLIGEKSNVIIYSLLGKKVLDISFTGINSKDIKLPKMSSGVYLVSFQTDKINYNKKIIID